MYNHYYPDSDGGWQKESRKDSPAKESVTPPEPSMNPLPRAESQNPLSLLSYELDMSDLITLFVLLTIADDKTENRSDALMTLLFYFFL